MEIKNPLGDLINKQITVPEIKTQHFDNSDDYTIIKKTRKGEVRIIKPEILEEIKARLELE